MQHANVATIADKTAGRKFSATYELLENMLLRLPMTEVLRAKSVCKRWKAVIESSLPLKEVLFLKDHDPVDGEEDVDSSRPMLQPGSLRILPIFTEVMADTERPWIFRRFEGKAASLYGYHSPTYYLQLPVDAEARLRDTIWREMLISQPASHAVAIEVIYPRSCVTVQRTLRNNEGVRLGEIVDRLPYMLRDGSSRNQTRIGRPIAPIVTTVTVLRS